MEEVYDLHIRLSQKFEDNGREILISKLKLLSTAELEALRRKCLSAKTGPALYLVGFCHEQGIGTPQNEQNDKEAVTWYERSADLGDARAMCSLGYCRRNGIGIPRDDELGVVWYQRSADLGHVTAMYNLGHCLLDGSGVPEDKKRAVEWLRRSADLGDPDAMNTLGYCLMNGFGIPTDKAEARDWFRRAKTARSYWNLGRLEEDPIAQLEYYCRALDSARKEHDGGDRSGWQTVIKSRLHGDVPLEVLRLWIQQKDQTAKLEAENQMLRAQIEELRTEVAYQPGGEGFQEARRDFESRLRVPEVSLDQ